MTSKNLLTEKLEEKYLKNLYRRYVHDFGHLTYKLPERLFYTTEQPEEIAIRISKHKTWYPVVELALSLEKKGYINFNDSRTSFSLTLAGYKKAEESQLSKALSWLNRNQGVISAVALIISIVSILFKDS